MNPAALASPTDIDGVATLGAATRRIAFALLMGVLTIGTISLVLLALNRGVSHGFLWVWLRSWLIGYVIIFPAILIAGPKLQAQIHRIIR